MRFRSRPNHATVVAYLALFVALGGTTYAATGGNFILGQANTATSQTGLTSNNAGKALNVTQQSTGTGATALGLNVPAGKPPFTVNSGTKVTNLNADKLDGKHITNWNVTDVIDTNGPLPAEGTFTSSGGKLLIMASGSGYRAASNAHPGLIGMLVKVDGSQADAARTYTNERDSHKAFVTDYAVVSGVSAGLHTIRLEAVSTSRDCGGSAPDYTFCTTTDENDWFNVAVTEIP
jgi:hypothetical protein